MNTQAAFKTLLVVLGIGAITGFQDWRHNEGAPAELRTQRVFAQCMKDRQEAAYRENPLLMGHNSALQNQRFEADCRFQANGGGIQIGKEAPPASGPTEVNGLHYSANGQLQTQSREQCLGQLDDARKRSPHGLNPDWEKHQKDHCAELYTEAKN